MKKSTNSKKTVTWLVAAVGALALFLIIASIIDASDFQFGTNDEQETNVATDDELLYVGVDDMHAILNDRSGQDFFVYIGRPTCPACQRYEPELRAVLEELNQSLRYFEIDRARDIYVDPEERVEGQPDIVSQINQQIGVTGVPHMVLIRDGEVVDFADGNFLLSGDSQANTLDFFERNGGLN